MSGQRQYTTDEIVEIWRKAKDVPRDPYTLEGALWMAKYLGALKKEPGGK